MSFSVEAAVLTWSKPTRGDLMRRLGFFGLLVGTALLVPDAARAQSGERAAGRRLATELCGDCHQAYRPFPLLHQYPPSFEDIAKLPSTTRLSLRVFLRSNHKQMPNFIISNANTDDIIDYILSLKRQ
jgi:mono/diheme cytochrome c family protein